MFGEKNVRPPIIRPARPARAAWLYLTRASRAVAAAISWSVFASKVAASPIACGKTVAKPPPATPCSASDQMLYSGTFSRGMARVRLTSWDAFSSSVMRATRSSTRWSIGSAGSWNGNAGGCAWSSEAAHASAARNGERAPGRE